MLIRFRVHNYRGFDGPIEMDFTDKKNYRFGQECVRGDLLEKVLILGGNGAGKTNFGYAITDIVCTIGGFSKDIGQKDEVCFINGDAEIQRAIFHYEFIFRGVYVTYEYAKTTPDNIRAEKFIVAGKTAFHYDLDSGTGEFDLDSIGAGFIDISNIDGSTPLLRTIANSPRLSDLSAPKQVAKFARNTLYYRAMWKMDEHIGFVDDDNTFEEFLIQNELVGDFTEFYRENCGKRINIAAVNGKLVIHTANKDIPFRTGASRGDIILCRLYVWIKRCTGNEALVFLDDFDDMFHFQTSENTIRRIIGNGNAQCIFVTHNTGLVSNDLIRPDCCFILSNNKLNSLASLTDKDIRRGHNLEKMLREGEFTD